MALSVDLAWILTVMLVAIRFAVVMLMSPVFSLIGLPAKVRVVIVLAVSATLVSGLPAMPAGNFAQPGAFALAALNELVLGGLLAFTLLAGFAAFQFAGRILDIQLGFGVVGLIDPSTRTQAPLLGTVLNMTAVLTFFLIGGHRLLLRGLAFSLERIPPGARLNALPLDTVVQQFGGMFLAAALLAAPVMAVVLFVDVAMAMMARTMPQMNIFIVGLPLKILVGLLVLAISLGFLGPELSRIFESIFAGWQRLIMS
jgi:flagellar biosynthesis protein FliR